MGFLSRKKRPTQSQHRPSPVDHLGYPIYPNPLLLQEPQHQHQAHLAPNGPTPPPPGGYLMPMPDCSLAGTPFPPPHDNQVPCLPVVVNQHYYLGSPPPPPGGGPSNHPYLNSGGHPTSSKLKLGSALDLAGQITPCNVVQVLDNQLPRWHSCGTQLINQGVAMSDQMWNRFNNVMTLIDGDKLTGHETDLFMYGYSPPPPPPPAADYQTRPPHASQGSSRKSKNDTSKGQLTSAAQSRISGDYFSKVELYANSKLPLNLPPLQLYIPSYPLLCLAAQYAEKVYEKPKGAERDVQVNAHWKTGTRAMCIKSVPMDHMDTIVFAIRGTASFMDWSVNLNTEPTPPTGFLDDTGNLCHAGFLSVARKMISPVAARLRQLLEENPRRASYSLLITGHSAGGAIAALLYSHMLATSKTAASELNTLTGCFRRVHCITFGAPPVSLLPLQRPANRPQFRKFMFLSFVNEGDPVARADKAYVKSLLELLAAPAPEQWRSHRHHHPHSHSSSSRSSSSSSRHDGRTRGSSRPPKKRAKGPVWEVPPCALSNAGRVVVLRSGDPGARVRRAKSPEERLAEGVVAQVVTDEQLRGVVWGDPVCHLMRFYAARIETLAVGAVTVQGR